MTSMTPEDVHDLLIKEMKNLSLPTPVERTLYSDMRNLCDRLWSEYESLDEKSDAERRRQADFEFCKTRKTAEEIIRFRVSKLSKLAVEAASANMVFAELDSLPPEEIEMYMAFRNGVKPLFGSFTGRWSMNPVVRDIADALDGSEYPLYIPASISKQARECGVQIVYGDSDDLIEFEGPFRDELGAWIPEDRGTRDYVSSEGRRITAVWGETKKVSWTYRTDIPHETFRIIDEDDDDDETYCIGIVFEAMPGETWSEEER